jgi:hypothetical protein
VATREAAAGDVEAELHRCVGDGTAMNHDAPGFYGDLLYRGGEVVVVRSLLGSVICPDWAADVTDHEYLMFLNAVMDPATQSIYASGKAHIGSRVVIVGPDNLKTVIPCGTGNYTSQLAVVDGRVVCYVVLSPTQYGLFDLAGALIQTRPIPDQYQGTSQGIRFIADDGAVVWGDQSLGNIFEGLLIHEWMQRGGYTGGQGHEGGFALSGNGVGTLYPSGQTFFPRIAVNDTDLAILYVAGPLVCWDTLTLPLEALPPLAAPKISVTHYDPLLKAGEPWHLALTIGDTKVDVEIDSSQQLWIDAENTAGEDHTGTTRQLTIEGPSPEPEPEPGPMPTLGRFWLQPNIGSKDMLAILDDMSRLQHVDVFAIPVQQVLTDETTPQLGPNIYPNLVAADFFRKLPVPLAIEMGSVKPYDCDAQNGIDDMQRAVQRVHDAGGVIAAFSMDEPLTANQYPPDNGGCRRPLAQVADAVAGYVHAVRALGPMQVGWLEAWPEVSYQDQAAFLSLLKARDALPEYWHLDIDWNRAKNEKKDPAKFLHDCQLLANQYGVTLGLFCNSTTDPIATDAMHYANVTALGKREQGIVPDIAHLCVASWAFRTGGTQDVPNNLGPVGLLATFAEVRDAFEQAPVPEPEPEGDLMFATLIDPTKETLAVKAVKPTGDPGVCTLVLADYTTVDNGKTVLHVDDVFSCQPDGSAGTRPSGTAGAYERCTVSGNVATFRPVDKYFARHFVKVVGL